MSQNLFVYIQRERETERHLSMKVVSRLKSSRLCQVLLVVAAYFVLYTLIKDKCTDIDKFQILSGVEHFNGPSVLLVAGTHGNEPAGSDALISLHNDFVRGKLKLKAGKLTIVPTLNPCGKMLGWRWQPHQLMRFSNVDLNRNYPQSNNEEGSCPVSNYIAKLALEHTFVIDGHEGYAFNHQNPKSMGSCVFPGQTQLARQIAWNAVEELNEVLEPPRGVSKDIARWQSRPDWPDLKGTLRWHCNQNNIHYILMETTGQNNIQPLSTRVQQQKFLILSFLRQLGMI